MRTARKQWSYSSEFWAYHENGKKLSSIPFWWLFALSKLDRISDLWIVCTHSLDDCWLLFSPELCLKDTNFTVFWGLPLLEPSPNGYIRRFLTDWICFAYWYCAHENSSLLWDKNQGCPYPLCRFHCNTKGQAWRGPCRVQEATLLFYRWGILDFQR